MTCSVLGSTPQPIGLTAPGLERQPLCCGRAARPGRPPSSWQGAMASQPAAKELQSRDTSPINYENTAAPDRETA
jgi:hypothetical protein